MSYQESSSLSQGLHSVTEKYHIKHKKRIARTFKVFAPLVLICVLAIGRVLLWSLVLLAWHFCAHWFLVYLYSGYFASMILCFFFASNSLVFGYRPGNLMLNTIAREPVIGCSFWSEEITDQSEDGNRQYFYCSFFFGHHLCFGCWWGTCVQVWCLFAHSSVLAIYW